VFNRFSSWLYRVSTGWVTFSGLLIFLVFSVLVLPGQAAQATDELGDIGSPDLSLYYTPEQLYQLADSYGADGREAYILTRFSFDLVWPLVYTIFLGTALSWTGSRAWIGTTRLRNANLAPILGMLFDFLENLTTSLVMVRYPAKTIMVDVLAPIFTFLKWILIGASFALLVVNMVQVGRNWCRSRRIPLSIRA
jgi:hypothetical protein